MATWTDVLTNVFTLTASVNSLKSDVARMNAMLLEMNERIIRLETGGDLAAEKAKNAALMAFQATNQELMKQVSHLQNCIGAMNFPPG